MSLWIGIVCSLIVGAVVMSKGEELTGIGLSIMFLGCLLSYNQFISCYAMGQLVQNTDVIAESYRKSQKKLEKQEKQNVVTKEDNAVGVGTCQICGREQTKLYNVTLRDGYGTRYRNICSNCVNQYDCDITSSSN